VARFDELLREARVGFSEAPDMTLLSALKRAAAHFCRQSGIWMETLDPITLVEGQAVYDWDTPVTGSVVERIESFKVDELAGGLTYMRTQDMHSLPRRTSDRGGVCAYAITDNGSTLTVWKTPDAAQAGSVVSVLAVLAPSEESTELPDFLRNEWHDAIVCGMRRELLGNLRMPWSDAKAAWQAREDFAEHIGRARREQHSGHHADMHVQMRPFA